MNSIRREVFVLQDRIRETIEYLQGTNAIPLIFDFKDFEIPAGAEVRVHIKKPSGYCEYDVISAEAVNGNIITIDVKDTMFDEVGISPLQIQIKKDEKTLVTFEYPVNVKKNYVSGDVPQSGNQSNFVDEAVERANTAALAANGVISAAQQAADRANEAADRVSETEVGAFAETLAEHTEKLTELSGTLAIHTEILAEHSEILAGIFNAIYPIGSIYMSVAAADPGALFGGTWERWGAGRVPVGINELDSLFDKPEETGGETYHTLTVDEMPAHTHAQNITSNTGKIAYNGPGTFGVGDSTKPTGFNTGEKGGGKSFKILQPYITCYMWKRIA